MSDCLTRSHSVSGKEKEVLFQRARFSALSRQPEYPQSSVPQSDSTPGQCGYTVPKTSSLPEQKKLPNLVPPTSTSDENEDELIQCPYDSHISYERVWGTNVPVMDHEIFKLNHPFSMLVAGPQEAGKSEFIKQLLSLKHYIMTNPPERIVWFYGRHQADLFCSLAQEIPSVYEGLPKDIEVMFDRSKRNICIIDDLMQSSSGSHLVEDLSTNGRHFNLSVMFVSQNSFHTGKIYRTISLNSTYIVVFKNPRDRTLIHHLAFQMFPSKPNYLQAAYEEETKDPYQYLFLDFHPNSPESARVSCCLYFPKDMQI